MKQTTVSLLVFGLLTLSTSLANAAPAVPKISLPFTFEIDKSKIASADKLVEKLNQVLQAPMNLAPYGSPRHKCEPKVTGFVLQSTQYYVFAEIACPNTLTLDQIKEFLSVDMSNLVELKLIPAIVRPAGAPAQPAQQEPAVR
jgi:hypothetical protein